LSRILDVLRVARRQQSTRQPEVPQESRSAPLPFQVLTVTSNKGGVGKTTVAANLAVYLRALREDLPILLLGLDEQPLIDRMFAIGSPVSAVTVAGALRNGSFASAVRLGQYGVHYVPTSPRISELKREIVDIHHLQKALLRTGWHGLVIIDTKSDFEILTRNAVAASDLCIVVVKDHASLHEARWVFEFLDQRGRGPEAARVLFSLMDLRVKYREEGMQDILALLLSEVRRRGYPHFPTFISRSPKVESLYTNPSGSALSVLHGAQGSIVHRQMRYLAGDVLEALDASAAAPGLPALVGSGGDPGGSPAEHAFAHR
jgi:cellulose biosynthesis protein BcsQ